MEEHISKGFLYTSWGNQLTVMEGDVIKNQWCRSNEALFVYGTRDNEWTKCDPNPKQICYGKLWLPERNDELGRKLLIEYHETTIDDLRKRIAAHEDNIEKLRLA